LKLLSKELCLSFIGIPNFINKLAMPRLFDMRLPKFYRFDSCSSFNCISGKTSKGRKMLTQGKMNTDDLSGCHLVYIGTTDPEKVSRIAASLSSTSVLTVSHLKDSSDLKIIIKLIKKKNKFRFRINQDAAENASLKVGSNLLRLGTK
jgi:hypothetical protein